MKHMLRVLSIAVAALIAGCAGTASYAPTGKIEVLWTGHATFRITTMTGKVIVIDPWLTTNPKTPAQYKDLKALGKVDAILVTHAHPDHITDAPALAKLNNVRVVMSSTLIRTLLEVGVLSAELTTPINKGGTVTPVGPDVKVTMVRAEHSAEYVWRNPATGKDEIRFGGEPAGFIIELENGFKIYHTGDTGLFGDMKFIGEYYKPDLLLISIGGTLTAHPRDAAFATREWIKPKFAMPMHYGTLPILRGTPEEYIKALGDTSTKVIVLQPGEKAVF